MTATASTCPHCGARISLLALLAMAIGTGWHAHCRGCSRRLGFGHRWERASMAVGWAALWICFGLSIFEHNHLPYLGIAVVAVLATVLLCRLGRLRVVFPRRNWINTVNFGVLGVSFCALVLATPL